MALYTNIKGPINYTIVGSPTIEDGVVSGLSADDYLKIQTPLTYSGISNIEFYTRVKTPISFDNDGAYIAIASEYADVYKLRFVGFYKINSVYPASHVGYGISGGGVEFYNVSIQTNTWYRLRFKAENGVWTLYCYDDNGNLLGSANKTFDFTEIITNLYIGGTQASQENNNLQAIDLNETYININGNAWFGTSFSKVKLHSQAAVQYAVVGNPTIIDNVASGFTDKNDYLTLPEFNPGTNKWKFTTKVKFNSLSSHMSLIDRNSTYRCFQISIRNNGKFRINISNDGSNKANEVDGSHTVSINTIYYLSFEYTGTNYVFKYSTDNANWTTDITINNSNPVYSGATLSMGHSWYNGGSEKWNGDIYMNYTHLFVDDIDYDTWKINII